jgi:uncharacterized protein with ATP-grasp and redox domains
MKTYLDCIPCLARHALSAARTATDDEQVHERVLRDAIGALSQIDMSASPPVMAQLIHRLVREAMGEDDPYRSVKQRFNQLALDLSVVLREQIAAADDPLAMALRIALAGNAIDFGAYTQVTEADLKRTIDRALAASLEAEIATFRQALRGADDLLFLADNTGEIVFDRLLIEQLPGRRITVAVRGAPVINDATREDAEIAGLTDLCDVIDNGSDGPGTILSDCSAPFLRQFDQASLIIAKGQGNYETLSEVAGNIVFLFMAKCTVITRRLGCPIDTFQVHWTGSHSREEGA